MPESAKPELIARIGLESGPAVLDAAGEIYGDVANIAARVQALAEPGAVLVTARVQRQVAGLFVAEERGTQTLKGVPEPTALFRLVRASGGGRRSGQRNLTPLVGRDEEIAMLMRRWERARQGDGQLVLIVGEPGLGKSRLIEEFHSRLSDTPHTWVEWSCSQLLQNTPLHPIAEWGRQRFGGADTPAERRLADLENSLAQVKLDAAENAPLLAPLLDIPLPKERVSTLAPEELRRRQLAALTNWVIAGAKAQPLVLAFEDLHWADPTTLDVLRGIAERGALAPLLVVATSRPEFRPPWGMRSHHGTISLAPLDRGQVQQMVADLSARHALPRDVVEDVASRTGGVPLFVEEVTRLLLERGEDGDLRSHQAPSAGDAIWPRQQGISLVLSLVGSVVSWSSAGSCRGFGIGALQGCARNRPSCYFNVCANPRFVDPHLLRKLRNSKGNHRRTRRFGKRKRYRIFEGAGDAAARSAFCPDRKGIKRNRDRQRWNGRISVNGIVSVGVLAPGIFGESLCGPRKIRRCSAQHQGSDERHRDNNGTMVGGRSPPNRRRNRA